MATTTTRSTGFFGPDSVSWQVHREVTVLFGGARALLLQAAHPLVIAGAAATGFFERDPWKRLDRTLRLSYTVTFGSEELATAAADKINKAHERVQGTDPVTGKHYDAFDIDLLLWVHATLVDSALRMEELTVGALDDAGRQRFHEEQMIAAELLKLPRQSIPPTVGELREYMDSMYAGEELQVTPAALRLAALFEDPPKNADWRPVLKRAAVWGFGMLPASLREAYGVAWSPSRDRGVRFDMRLLRTLRPLAPMRYRYVAPYVSWRKGLPFPDVPGVLSSKRNRRG